MINLEGVRLFHAEDFCYFEEVHVFRFYFFYKKKEETEEVNFSSNCHLLSNDCV